MKKIAAFLLAAVVVVSLLGSCAKEQETNGKEPSSGTNAGEAGSGSSSEKTKITVLFISQSLAGAPGHEGRFDYASRVLAETYGIEVERYHVPGYGPVTKFFDSNESSVMFFEKLYAEMLAGKGPDIFLSGPFDGFWDLPKKMDAGAFYDLNEFIENDGDFDITEYEEILMNEGLHKGKRYIFPLSYAVYSLLISKEKYEALGLLAEDFSTYERFLSTWEDMQRNGNLKMMAQRGWGSSFIEAQGWLGECVDYESGTVDFDLPSFRRVVELLQREHRLENRIGPLEEFETYPESLFHMPTFFTLMFTPLYSMDTKDMLLLPVPNANGNNTAQIMEYCMMSSSTENPDAAWLFLKTFLSDECQRELMQRQFHNYVTTKSALIDEDIETKIAIKPIHRPELMYDDDVIAMIKEIYLGYDNAVINYERGRDLYTKMSDYIESNEDQDFDSFKAELENYYRIYLTE